MEGARPHALGDIGVAEHVEESGLDLTCRLVGEGDGEDGPRGAGLGDKLREDVGYILCGHISHELKRLNGIRVNALRQLVGIIGVAIFNYISYSVNQNGGLSGSRAGKHENRVIDGEYRPALLGVKKLRIHLIKERSLGFQKFFFD